MHENEDRNISQYLSTHSEEDPLQHLAIVVRVLLGIKPEDVLLVVMLREIQEDRGGFEHVEVASGVVDDRGDAAVRIQLDEPRFLED